jgi:hypothetical protein
VLGDSQVTLGKVMLGKFRENSNVYKMNFVFRLFGLRQKNVAPHKNKSDFFLSHFQIDNQVIIGRDFYRGQNLWASVDEEQEPALSETQDRPRTKVRTCLKEEAFERSYSDHVPNTKKTFIF